MRVAGGAGNFGDRACVDEARDRRARSKPSAVVRRSGDDYGRLVHRRIDESSGDEPVRGDRWANAVRPLGRLPCWPLADVNLLVVQLLVPCVRNALRILEGMRTAGYNLDRTKLVCNRVGRDAGHLSPSQVAETLGLDVFASIPDDWQTVSAAINLGEPLRSHSPKSKVRIALQEVAERLHRPEGTAEDKDGRKKGGLIGRIFANT